eukprot:TRINITY_DN30884_c0_g1_i1.p1 TRINITY_DN30884_c0_g1~~TRINITY_DN30884_c0_g1_i1.p1  ORF type:complete len:838 (+),score=155.38 TRINITY_DN30884_c0_g1_i1:35-2515(+)
MAADRAAIDVQRSNVQLARVTGAQTQVLGMSAQTTTPAQATEVPIQQTIMKSAPKQRMKKNASEVSLSSASKISFGTSATAMGLFPRDGEQIKPLSGARPPPRPDVLEEIWTSMENVKSEVVQVIEAQERKLDSIFSSMSQLSDALGTQVEAARGMEQRQHIELVNKLAQVEEHLEQVQKKEDMDDLALRLLDRMNLPNILDRKLTNLSDELHILHQESEGHRMKILESMTESGNNTVTAVNESMARIAKEMQEAQDLDMEQFHVVMGQLTQVSQSLNLEYVKLENVIETSQNQIRNESQAKLTSKSKTKTRSGADKQKPYGEVRIVRDLGTQTENPTGDASTQTDASLMKSKRHKASLPKKKEIAKPPKLKEAEDIKAKAMRALIKPQYNVFDEYYTSGCAQRIARARPFEIVTLLVVCVNAVWMAVETDTNHALVLNEADPFFQIVENIFCIFFFGEITIRFLAFANKAHAFMDMWFVFDFFIVLGMVSETWLVPFFLFVTNVENPSKALGNLTMFRAIRMVKLLRLSRLTKILRAVPELLIIIKAMFFASRSVSIFCCFWLVLIYFFAIILRQISDGSRAGEKYFRSVPESMNTLLLRGILADYADIVNDISDPNAGNAFFGIVMAIFVVLASITVMYMLVGVLVEAVSKIAAQEKENLTVSYIAAKVREKLENEGRREELAFSKAELQALLIDPQMAQLLIGVDIDIVALVDTLDIVYEDMAKVGSEMTFEKVIDLLLNGRGKNSATVRDTKDVLRIVKSVVKQSTEEMVASLQSDFATIHACLSLIRAEVLENKDFSGEVDADYASDGEVEERVDPAADAK